MGFEHWDTINEESSPLAAAPLESLNPVLANGYYTLSLPDGSHRTFRIHTQNQKAKFAAGKRIISMLIGPDNTDDYERFGFVSEQGISVWKKFKGKKQEEYASLIWKIAAGGECIEGYDVELSKRCLICNRLLTDPDSIDVGIGPECRRKSGV